MASRKCLTLLCFIATLGFLLITTKAQLSENYYDGICSQALPVIRNVVFQAIIREPRMGASLLRLHFHDCFVNGCDGSVLLDDTSKFKGEKTAFPNLNSLRGFNVVDEIKAQVDKICGRPVVSCADTLAVAARDSVNILGGPYYEVLLGRKDAKTASWDAANANLPAPTSSFSDLMSNFDSHGLNLTDLVVLSAGHTIGLARCTTFRDRIYNDTDIDSYFATVRQRTCHQNGGDNNTAPLDATPFFFDTMYFWNLIYKRGLLHSDQELYPNDGSVRDKMVQYYAANPEAFKCDFGNSMIKMGNIKPLFGNEGEVRKNCRRVN